MKKKKIPFSFRKVIIKKGFSGFGRISGAKSV